MPPKKKQPRNAFFFFMLDYKARCERNGERFPNGLRDVQLEAGPEWNHMSPAQRKPYEDMAKEEKTRMKGDSSRKETCWHNTFDTIEQQKQEQEEEKVRMNQYIENTMRSLASNKLLAEHKWYLIHVNYFCITEGEVYYPAEIAICEFSLGSGITNVFHTICSLDIPIGYRHDAVMKSESTHKIPVKDPLSGDLGENNFYNILQGIKAFLEPSRQENDGEYPPLFTMSDNVNLNTSYSAARKVIEFLCMEHGDFRPEDVLKVYYIDKFFFELQNASSNLSGRETNFPAISIAQIELEKDIYNYTQEIACPFHYEQDAVEYCSKSYVQRWAFVICDQCCQDLNIILEPGRHVPLNADINYSRKRQEEASEKKVAAPKPFTVKDYSKMQASSSTNDWVPVEQPPMRRDVEKVDLSRFLPKRAEPKPFDNSEENFPAIPVSGRGRGRFISRGGNSNPPSFAQAMKSKK